MTGAAGALAPDDPGFRVTTAVTDRATTVTVTGAVDMLTSPSFGDAVAAAQQAVPRGLIIDLNGVDFLGSAGLSVLVEAVRRATEAGSVLVVVAANHPVVHALEVTGLDAVLCVVPDRDTALARVEDS